MEQHVVSAGDKKPASPVKRFLPIGVLVLGLIAFFAFGLDEYVSLEVLKENRQLLLDYVAQNAALASIVFLLVYTVAVAFSIPGGALLTIVGGFMFGIVWGASLVVVGATLGATCVFLAAKTALGDTLHEKAGPWMVKLEEGFQENATSYLITLRLVPLAPFWLVNLAPAFFGVRLRTFVITTFFGIIPGTVVYASVGNGVGATFDAGGEPDLGIIFKPEILLPLIGIALLSLVPVVYKKMKARKA